MPRRPDPDAPRCCRAMVKIGSGRWLCPICRRSLRLVVGDPGRKPINGRAMTEAERQRRCRARKAQERGEGGGAGE